MVNIIEVDYKWAGILKKRDVTKYIVLHHAKAKSCTVQDIDAWHKENGWAGFGYHYFTNKKGEIYRGRPIDTVGAHCLNNNEMSIGICFEGDFDQEGMTDIQVSIGIELVRDLLKSYTGCMVVRHKDLVSTDCPGKYFQDKIILEGMKPMDENQVHWAEKPYQELLADGLDIKERRFDDEITRGECFALVADLLKTLKKDGN